MTGSASANPELVFVVDISSFTAKGFTGSSAFDGRRVDIEFDDADAGLTLTREMSLKVKAKVGSKLSVIAEDDGKTGSFESAVAAVSGSPRFSISKLYYFIGESGGAVIKIRKV